MAYALIRAGVALAVEAKTSIMYLGARHRILDIKEIRSDFTLDRMPSGDFGANAVHFAIGVMTHNLFIVQRLLTMPEPGATKTIKSIRWLLIEVGAELICHGRRIILKVALALTNTESTLR